MPQPGDIAMSDSRYRDPNNKNSSSLIMWSVIVAIVAIVVVVVAYGHYWHNTKVASNIQAPNGPTTLVTPSAPPGAPVTPSVPARP
jgi:hypothetical protein